MSKNVKLTYTVMNRETGKVYNIFSDRESARTEKRGWKEVGEDAIILQSRYQHVYTQQVR